MCIRQVKKLLNIQSSVLSFLALKGFDLKEKRIFNLWERKLVLNIWETKR